MVQAIGDGDSKPYGASLETLPQTYHAWMNPMENQMM